MRVEKHTDWVAQRLGSRIFGEGCRVMKECYWLRNRLRVECVEESFVQSRAFENGDVNLVLTQVRLNREHLNIAKFEPEHGPDPMLDLVLVGSKWRFKIQICANGQDKLVVISRSVEQDVLSPTEASAVRKMKVSEMASR